MKNIILGHSAIYLLSAALNKAIPFLLLPIITRYLSPAEYGQISIFLVLVSVYLSFIGMNIQLNISRQFHRSSKKELATIVTSCLLIVISTTIVYSGFNWMVSSSVTKLLGTFDGWLQWIPILVFFQILIVINTTILRNEGKPFVFASYEIGQTILILSATIFFLTYQLAGWSSQVRGLIIGCSIFALISLIRIFKKGYISFHFDSGVVKKLFEISVPLIPHSLGIIIITISDRLFINHFVGLEAVGLYSIGYAFGMVVMIFTDSFMKAWGPWFYNQLSNENSKTRGDIVRYTYIYIIAVFLMALLISLVGNFLLPYFVDEQYLGASEFIAWIAFGYAIRGIYQIFFPYLVYFSETKLIAYSTIAAATCNLILNYLLISWLGAIGAAYSTVISLALSAFLVILIHNRLIKMPWKIFRT